jgi:hypothetical protein
MSHDPVRVFIGSGEASLLERKVLIHSLRKNTRRKLDIYVFNGTHNAIEKNNEPPVLAPMSLRVKYRNYTEFSLYRYLMPQLCGHQGRAIHLDSDMVCLGDIGELFDMPMHGNDFLSIKAYDTGQWGPSVMLVDCATCRFDLEQICRIHAAGRPVPRSSSTQDRRARSELERVRSVRRTYEAHSLHGSDVAALEIPGAPIRGAVVRLLP